MCVRCGTGRIAWCTDPFRHGDLDEAPVPVPPTLLCAICLELGRWKTQPCAVTIANGTAVCMAHLTYVISWPEFDEAVRIARGNT